MKHTGTIPFIIFYALATINNTTSIPPVTLSIRISNGEPASPVDYPYFVSIRLPALGCLGTVHLFAGTILNSRWILTVALYVPEVFDPHDKLSLFYAVVGSGDASSDGIRYDIDHFVRHPAYDNANLSNNIAVMRANRTIEINERVQPIGWSTEWFGENYPGFIVGYPWVRIELPCAADVDCELILLCLQRNRTNELRSLNVTTLRNIDCRGYLDDEQQIFVSDNTICADSYDDGLNVGAGDYGTALISARNNRIVAIASMMFWEDANLPDIYLRVAPYIEWIEECMVDAAIR